MTQRKIFKELEKLAALMRERVPAGAFNAEYIYSQDGEKCGYDSQYRLIENHACGWAACVWGWSQVFEKMGLLVYDPILFIDENSRQFITSWVWVRHATEHTLEAAIARIEYVVEHWCAPDNWRNQVYEQAPVSYRDINHNQKQAK